MINSFTIGKICLIILYLISGLGKIKNFNPTSIDLKNKFENKFKFVNLPLFFYKMILFFVILLLIFGSLWISFSKYLPLNISKIYLNYFNFFIKYALILFTTLATYLYHYPAVGKDFHHFFKNLSIIGGFLILLNNSDDLF